ncbi:conjugative relaxase [Nostoc sphaeroides CCNUC1]|uniref:Conjugative relaxase n=1 Tax=Nostoc sphaeroides CCNUC1 TaxID=2653204 RepID=A0A5P8WAA5_9NOSO|nr:conjugative relaxase [Nostoc sphaeroides CCNUC1]
MISDRLFFADSSDCIFCLICQCVSPGLLQKSGAKVKVVSLPGPDKGVDDFIVAHSPLAYEKLSHEAMNLRDWQRRNQYKSAATI